MMDFDIFNAKNPWRQGVVPDAPAIERSLLAPLVAALGDPSVTVLLGARAAGKTTLLLHVIREAVETRLAAPQDVFYFDLDTMTCGDVLASNRSLLDFVGTSRKPRIVVIDEAQRLPNPGLLLKSVHDLHLPIKLLATGSSSLELRSRIRESLAGRRHTFHLWPLSPSEWLAYCRDGVTTGLRHYRTWGGYPAVARETDPARRSAYLAELLRAYLDRDIEDFLRVERLDAFEGLLRLLARHAGQLVNVNEIAATLQLSRDTVQRYVRYLQETFVVRVVPPFFRNLRSELTKMPKVYFADLGLRNLLAGELHPTVAPPAGSVDENLVFVALLSLAAPETIRFWRTEGKAEVDFVVETNGDLVAVEVKAGSLARPSVPPGMRSFVGTYAPKAALVLNANLDATAPVNSGEVRFVSQANWLAALTAAVRGA